MTAIRSLVLAALLVAPIAARAGPDPALGSSVRANIITQTIDMNPRYIGDPRPGDNGQKAVDALIRYRTGKLKPLIRTNGKPELGAQGGAQDTPTVSIPIINSSDSSRSN